MRADPLPLGLRVLVDPGVRQLDDHTLLGGTPARVMRLSGTGLEAWRTLREGVVTTAAAAVLGRRLSDAGLIHPALPTPVPAAVTVIIPVRDRVALLEECLAALGDAHPVVVVDDGSADVRGVAAAAARHGADVVRRPVSGGPGAARDSGLAHARTDLVAFLDSDCVPPAGWVERLAGHLDDPLVAAVAPRITALPSDRAAARVGAAGGGLDLGPRPARVQPGGRVPYVPTAALLVRRTALASVSLPGGAFDQRLRYGEDVDLCWRLHEGGWRIRYEPAVSVPHHDPDSWPALLARRYHYGTSAAPLAARHPGSLAPLVLQLLPTMTVAAVLTRRPALAAGAYAASIAHVRVGRRRAGLPTGAVVGPTFDAVHRTWLGLGTYGAQLGFPLLVVGLTRRHRARAGVLSLLLGPGLAAWQADRPALDPARFVAGRIAVDVAYGAGVWRGSIRHRTVRALLPRLVWRSLHVGAGSLGAPPRAGAGADQA